MQRRGGMGVIAIKFKPRTKGEPAAAASDRIACLRSCRSDEQVMMIANNGVIVRQKVGAISGQSRSATGVRVQRLDRGTLIKEVALISPEEPAAASSSSTAP